MEARRALGTMPRTDGRALQALGNGHDAAKAEGAINATLHDSQEAVAFLAALHPEAARHLVGIRERTNGKAGVDGATFEPGRDQDLAQWVDARQGRRNIYYHLNPLCRMVPESRRADW